VRRRAKAAEAICRHLGLCLRNRRNTAVLSNDDLTAVREWRARRIDQVRPRLLPMAGRTGFALIEPTFTDSEARLERCGCSVTTICDKCVEVCRTGPLHVPDAAVRWMYP